MFSAFIAAAIIELYALKTGKRLPSELSTLVMIGLTLPVYFTMQFVYNLRNANKKEAKEN